jgi:hypothetical protein
MPNTGRFSISSRAASTAYVQGSGSPGPFERKMPSGANARASAAVVVAGTTVTSQPAAAMLLRMLRFMPKS